MSSISAQIPTSNKTRLNEFKRSIIHLGANPDQQRNTTKWVQKKFHVSWRKSRSAVDTTIVKKPSQTKAEVGDRVTHARTLPWPPKPNQIKREVGDRVTQARFLSWPQTSGSWVVVRSSSSVSVGFRLGTPLRRHIYIKRQTIVQ